MPIEIREVTLNANIKVGKGNGGKRMKGKARKDAAHEDLVAEVVDRVLEVLDRKKGR